MLALLNFLYFALVLAILLIAVNEEFNLSKIRVDDVTKVLLLMCLLVVVYKTTNLEKFFNRNSSYESRAADGPERKCGYADIDLNTQTFNPQNLCNYMPEKSRECRGQKKLCNVALKENTGSHHLPNSYVSGTYTPDGSSKPSLNGSLDTMDKSNFVLSQNESRPECCPGIHSDSRGCVCPNKDQNRFISSRGGNSSYRSEY